MLNAKNQKSIEELCSSCNGLRGEPALILNQAVPMRLTPMHAVQCICSTKQVLLPEKISGRLKAIPSLSNHQPQDLYRLQEKVLPQLHLAADEELMETQPQQLDPSP